jgi:hypothetical protein
MNGVNQAGQGRSPVAPVDRLGQMRSAQKSALRSSLQSLVQVRRTLIEGGADAEAMQAVARIRAMHAGAFELLQQGNDWTDASLETIVARLDSELSELEERLASLEPH